MNSERCSSVGVHNFIVISLSDEDKAKRNKSLHSMGVTELFEDGTIAIDMPICKGIAVSCVSRLAQLGLSTGVHGPGKSGSYGSCAYSVQPACGSVR